MRKLPQAIVDDLMNDKDFLSLDDAGQDEILGEIQKKIGIQESPENLLQRVAKIATPTIGAFANKAITGAPGMGAYEGAHEAKTELIKQANPSGGFGNVLMDLASNPENVTGGIPLAKGISRGTSKLVKSFKNPSGVFQESMNKASSARPNARVDYSSIINDALADPKAKKVIEKSGVLSRYGGTRLTPEATLSDNLSNLTLKDSQDLMNMIKDGVRQSVREGTVKSTEIGIAKMFKELSQAQRSAFPEMKSAAKLYGTTKEIGKFAKSASKKALSGLEWTAGAAAVGYPIARIMRGK